MRKWFVLFALLLIPLGALADSYPALKGSSGTFSGDVSAGGTLGVTGATSLGGNATIGASGGGNRTVTINSSAANNKLTINTYPASAGISSDNQFGITASAGYLKLIASTNSIWLLSATGFPTYFDTGTLWYWRSLGSNVNRMILNSSNGNLDVTGGLAVGVSTDPPTPARKLEVTDSGGNQMRLTYAAGTIYTDLGCDNAGNLVAAPTGGALKAPLFLSSGAAPTVAAGLALGSG